MDWENPPEVAEVRRWQLLAAGRRVIERQGVNTFTVADVTREARMAKGTFYTYFASRDEFVDTIRAALGAEVIAALRTSAAGPWDGIFVRMMGAVAGWLDANSGVRDLFGPAYLARAERPTKGPFFALVRAVISDGIDLGVFRPLPADDQDPVTATALVVYDVLSAGINRVSPVALDTTSIETTAEFVQRALHFDAAAASGRDWAAPPAP